MENELYFELPIGLDWQGETHKEVELLEVNGVAEKIFLKKLAEKPFTWQGNVISAGVKSIGSVNIGADVRDKYLKEGAVTIPAPVLSLPLCEVNTLLVEIHRRLWEHEIPKQSCLCRHCGREMIVDIDLNRIDFSEESKQLLESRADEPFADIVANLRRGFTPPPIKKVTDKEEYSWIPSTTFNRFIFRIPTLKDAIDHEKYFSDSVVFWRYIAYACLQEIQQVDSEGNVLSTLPREFHTYYGMKIFNEVLTAKDLKIIRSAMVESLPTLPFAYEDICPYCEKSTPMVMEASSFFSE